MTSAQEPLARPVLCGQEMETSNGGPDLTTFDWVPEMPRGYIRVRWALEEAGLRYRVKSVPFGARNAEHFANHKHLFHL